LTRRNRPNTSVAARLITNSFDVGTGKRSGMVQDWNC
jgi:hypothetical protein